MGQNYFIEGQILLEGSGILYGGGQIIFCIEFFKWIFKQHFKK
jgi:hypothetical protein